MSEPTHTYVVEFVHDEQMRVILVASLEHTPEALAADLEGRGKIDKVIAVSEPLVDTLDNLDYRTPRPFGVKMFSIRREAKFDYHAHPKGTDE